MVTKIIEKKYLDDDFGGELSLYLIYTVDLVSAEVSKIFYFQPLFKGKIPN